MTNDWMTEITLRGIKPTDTERLALHILEQLDGSASGYGPNTVTATFTAHGDTYSAAYANALDHLARVALPDGWEIAELDLARADIADLQLHEPPIPRLVGITEIAGILGVTRQRAHAIASTPAFPEPVAELAAGPVYLETAVRAFAAVPRRPGRPATPPPDVIEGKYRIRVIKGKTKSAAAIRVGGGHAKKAPTRHG
jgi:hypothetical protein